MKKKTSKSSLVLISFFVAIILTSGCLGFSGNDGEEYEIPYSKASGSRITLINNEKAKDPSLDELVSFLESDETENNLYDVDSFVCGDFAEMLHNNAEASGIRAGWVAITFEDWEPHASNVFETTDRGLVYIDCTRSNVSVNDEEDILFCNQDKVAYLAPGKVYGTVSIDKVTSLNYSFYEDYRLRWELLNAEYKAYSLEVSEHNKVVEAYNATVERHHKDIEAYEEAAGGRTVIADPLEYERLNEMQQEIVSQGKELYAMQEEINANKKILDEWLDTLDSEKEKIGCYWEPFGVVEDTDVYW
ncbi:MAG: hypothetical protein SVK08_06115 [Halobacteriota archaeon]|nr:hypothetical protein [Halobacteriota archaeon]